MDQQTDGQLVNEADLPPTSVLGQPLDYNELLNKDVLELLGVTQMGDEEKEEFYFKVIDTIQNRVIARILDQLTDADIKAWDAIDFVAQPQQAADFLKNKGLDLAALIVEESLIYKTELVSLANQLRIT